MQDHAAGSADDAADGAFTGWPASAHHRAAEPGAESAPATESTVADRSPGTRAAVRTGLPFGAVLGVLAGLAILATAQTPLRDIDVYWHILAGRELLAGIPADEVGRTWSFAPSPLPWTSTQWLSEILISSLHAWFGWAGLAAFRVVTAAIAIGVLARTTLVGRSRALAGFPFLLTAGILAFVSQERPAQFTLIGAAALGGVLVAGIVERRTPPWWILVPATIVWANLHGGWVLMPGVLALIAVAVAVQDGLRAPVVRRAALLAVACTAAGCLTPSRLGGLTAPLRFSSAAELIREWRPVEPMTTLGWLTVALLAVIVVGWCASRELPRSEAVVTLALLCFTWTAYRDLALGMALMAPLAAHRLNRAFPAITGPEPRWSAPFGVAAASALTVVAVAVVSLSDNLPWGAQPIVLAQQIAALPAGQRVLNDYNTSGVVLYFGGESTRVAIDGRSDRYGADYIQHYVDLLAVDGHWQPLLETLDPTAALLEEGSPLAHVLTEERGWTPQGGTEAGYVLLVRPTDAP